MAGLVANVRAWLENGAALATATSMEGMCNWATIINPLIALEFGGMRGTRLSVTRTPFYVMDNSRLPVEHSGIPK